MSTTRQDERVLQNTTPGHSKEYRVWLEQSGVGWFVRFAYGRIGGTLKTGRKTETPVVRGEAERIARNLVSEKEGRGYRLLPPVVAPRTTAARPAATPAAPKKRPAATSSTAAKKGAVEINVNRSGRFTVPF